MPAATAAPNQLPPGSNRGKQLHGSDEDDDSEGYRVTPPPVNPQPSTSAQGSAAPPRTSEQQAQRATTSKAVLRARKLALAAKALVQPPKGRLLRGMQEAELQQKMAESKVIPTPKYHSNIFLFDTFPLQLLYRPTGQI